MAFRQDIQGLRAVAVIAVIFYHAADFLPGGFVGVDIFFVISGFVITRSLHSEHGRTSRIDLKEFYRRRIRRLTPVLTLVILTTIPLSILFGPNGSVETGAGTGMAATVFSANVVIAGTGGYFAAAAELNPMNHMWSLSLEEQFYLVFPAMIVVLFWLERRRDRPRTVVLGLVFVSALSLGLGLFMSYGPTFSPFGLASSRSLVFFLMPVRAWQFGAGAILAILLAGNELRFAKRGHATVGVIAMLIAFIALSDDMNYPGAWAILPTVATVIVIANADALLLRPLRHPAMGRLGDVSYSWYLWHWPAMVFAGAAGVTSRPVLAFVGLATLPVAMFTYDHVEMRFRHDREESRRAGWVGITAASLAVGLAMVGIAALSVGAAPSTVKDARASSDSSLARTCSKESLGSGLLGCQFGEGSVHVALIGDSNAAQFSESVVGAATELGWQVSVVTMNACPIIDVVVTNDGVRDTACADYSERARDWVATEGVDVAVLAVATDIHLELAGRKITSGQASGADAYVEGLRTLIDDLLAVDTRVIVVDPIPKFSLEPGLEVGAYSCSSARLVLLSNSCALSITREEAQDRRQDALEVHVRAMMGTEAETLDLFDVMCPDLHCREREGNVWQYSDARHISVAFSERLVPTFEAALAP